MPDSKELIKIDPQVIHNLHNIKKEKFIEFYCQDEVRGNVSVACAATGIDRGTYYDWLVADEEFKKIITDAKMQMCDDMEQVLIHRAIDKSDTALISSSFSFSSLHPSRFFRRSVVSIISSFDIHSKGWISWTGFPFPTSVTV